MTGETRERPEAVASAGTEVVPALCFRGVGYRYRADAPLALDGIELEVAPGEVLAVVGGNGSGKSTLARLANGLLAPEAGEVMVGGISTTDQERLWEVRSHVGLLFQDPEDQIVGASVEDDVAFGLENLGVPRDEMRRRVAHVLAALGLAGEAATEPHLLSGGQKQRLALAGVVVLDPTVLVLDEPTSMLDPAGRAEVLDRVRELAAGGVAVVLITQHMDETLGCDRLVALDRARVVFDGPPAVFFRSRAFEGLPLEPPRAMALAETLAAAWRSASAAPDAWRPPWTEVPLTEGELLAALAAL
jgi:energy-coupling factor transport system ATP-binding protein